MLYNKPIDWFLLGAGLLTLGSQAQAGMEGNIGSAKPLYQPLMTLTLGPDFVQQGQAQHVSLLPPFQNYYTNTNHSTTVIDAGVFVGVERILSDKLWAQLGVSGYIDTQMSPTGDVWLFGLPQFDTLSYSYNVHHKRAMIEGKFLANFNRYEAWHPYISWGVGAAFNQATHYQETPLIPGAVPTAPFASHTQTSFTWGIGAGVDYTFNPHLRFGAGYRFADLGTVSLGATPSATTTQTLSVSHLYTSQLQCQLTVLM